jgi:hypothetical protein
MPKLSNKEKAVDRAIDQLYRARCQGMQINVMRIPELFKQAREAIAAGKTAQEVGDVMVAFVEQEKI